MTSIPVATHTARWLAAVTFVALLPLVTVSTLLGSSAALAADKPSASAAAGTFREIRWDELVPKGWDPLKGFRDQKPGALSDNDPRSQAMLAQMREVWDNAPTNPLLDGNSIRLAGYLVPLEESKGELKEFLLVPYFGACIHTPPPPANQIVHVFPARPLKGFQGMVPVWVNGTLKTQRNDSGMGVSGYRLDAVRVEHYEAQAR